MKTYIDQMGNTVTLEAVPQRIVSLVPSQTELLFDLGLEDRIVGITKFCVHPYHLKSTKKIIGGTKKVHIEKIKLLQPDIIIANKEENTEEIVTALREVAPVWVSNIITVQDSLDMIAALGQLFAVRTQAQQWIDKINHAVADFNNFMQGREVQKAAYLIWKNPYMAAGGDTFINEMLKLNKFTNIYEDRGRYPEIIIQKMRIQGDPDVVLLSSEPYPFKEEDAFEIGRFTHHAKTVFVDGEMFSWYGSRMVKAFPYFKQLQERIG
ncbi:ABC transporter substrate-binding protein [Flavobacterium salilacus subsp. salilacus]|uniref:ABC transporter substrate-binding protein n=1 Tax=Flavobacterium TaxID=237 RepID=UPI001074EE66|nr:MULTISPECIES: helical backbone metal receptor [Flavobacterium]KAF2516832.1 ABC transporter substrate-binding protein [Flavobacterium salilacus subsp. salilacus]MBE1615809.1 ABC transporter substrate-binding protein [Flavobacterium sp. SaA2.13]